MTDTLLTEIGPLAESLSGNDVLTNQIQESFDPFPRRHREQVGPHPPLRLSRLRCLL
jgi:hypothetical protein